MQEQRLKFECGGTTTKRVQPLASRSVEDRCSTSRSSSTSTSQQSIVSAETVGGHRDSTPQLVLANRDGRVRIASFRADALWLSTVVSAGPPTPVQLTVLPVFAAAASSPFFDDNDAQRVVKVADRIDPASPFAEEVHRDRMHVPGERSSAVASGSASSSAYFGRYHPVFWTCGGGCAASSSGRGSPGGVVQGSSQVYLRPFAVQCGIARQAGRCMSLLSERGHSAKKLEGVGTGRTVVSVFAVTTNVFVVVGSRPFLAAYEIAEAEAYSPPPGAESEDCPAQQAGREQGVVSSGSRSTFLGELWEEVENTMEEILGNGSGGANRLSQFSQKALDVGRKLGFRAGKQNCLEAAPLPCAPCWTASEGTAETAAQAPDGQTFAILNKHGEISVHRLERGGFDQSARLQLVHLWRASGTTSCVMSLSFPTRAHLALGYGADEQSSVKSGRSSSSRKTAVPRAGMGMASHALSKIEVWRVADSDRRIRTWSETAGQGSLSSSTHGIVPDARLGCFYALEGLEVPSGEDQENAAEHVTYSARQLTVQKNASEHAYDARAHHDAASAHSPTDAGNAEINGYETAHEEDTVEQQVENVLRGLIEAKEGPAARPLHCIPWDQPQILLRALRGVKAARQKRLFLASLLTAHVVENEARTTSAAVSKHGAIVSTVEQRGDPSAPAPGAPENASTAERLLRPSLTTQLVLEKVLADAKLEAEWDLDEVVVNRSGSRGAESSGESSSSFREMLRGEARRLADYVDILSQNLTSGERSAAPSRSTSTNVLSARKKAALFGDGDREDDDSEEAGSPFHIVARPEVPQSTGDQGKGGHNATNSVVSLLEIVGGPLLLQEKALNCGAPADTTSTSAVDEYCSFLEEEVLRPEDEEQEIIDVEQQHQQSTTSNVADALYGFSGRGWASLYGVAGLRSAPSTSLPAGFLPSFGGCLDLFVGDAREQDLSIANKTDSEHRQEGTSGGSVRSTSSPDSSSKKRASAARTQPPAAGCTYDHWSAWDLRRRVQPRNAPAQAPAAASGVFLVSYRHFSEAEADSLSLDVPLCEFLFRPLLHASSASSNYLHLLFRTISDWDLPVRELQFALLSWYCNCELKTLLECSSVKKESVVNLAGNSADAQRKAEDEVAEPASYIGSAIYDTLFGGGSTSTAAAGGANYGSADVPSDVLPASGGGKSETADSGGSEQENACSKAFPALRSLDEIQRTGLFQDEEDSRVRSPSHVTTASSEPAAGTATARTVHMRGLALAAMKDGVADALRPSTGVDGPGRQDDAGQNEDSDSNREDVLWRELGLQVGDYSRQDAGATKNTLQEQTNADMQEPNFVERPPLRSVEEILREAEYNGEELDYTRLLGATLSLENRFFRPWVHRYLAKKEHIHVAVFNHRVKKLKRRELGGCGLWPFVLRVFSLQFVLEAVRRLDGRCLAHVWLLLLQLRLSKDAVAVFDVAVQDDDPVPAGRTAAAAAAEGFGLQHMLRTKQFLTPAATAGGRAGGAVRGSPEVNKRSVLHMLGSDEGGGPALDNRTFVRELETDLTQLKTHALLSAVFERLDVVLKFAVSCAAATEETGIGLPSLLRAHAPVVTFSRFQHCLPTLLVGVAEKQAAGTSTANIVKATKLHWQGILETSEAHLFGTSYFDLGLGVDPVLLLKLLPDAFRYDVDASGAQPTALVQTNHSTSITFVKEHSSNSEWVGFSGETTETNTVSVTAKKVGTSARNPVSADPATTAKRHAGPHDQKCWQYFRDRIRLDSALCRGFLGVNAGLEDAGWNKALARALRGPLLHDRDTENIKRVAEARSSAYGPDAATRCLGLTQEPLLSLFVLNLRGVAPINQLSWAWIVKLVLRIDRSVGRLHELRTTLKVIAVCANARLQLKRSPTPPGGGSRSSSKNKAVSRSRTSSSATSSEVNRVLVPPEARLPLVLGLALRDPNKLTSQALALADDWRIPGEAQASLLCHYLDNLLDDELERLLREPLVRVETLFFQNFRNYERICESLTRSLDQRIGIALTLLCRDSSEKHGMVLCLLPKSTLDRYLHLRLSAGLMDRFSGSGGGASGPTATAVGVLSRASSLLEHPVLKRFESGPLGQCRQIVAKLKTQL
eukprot:g2974.t1